MPRQNIGVLRVYVRQKYLNEKKKKEKEKHQFHEEGSGRDRNCRPELFEMQIYVRTFTPFPLPPSYYHLQLYYY